MPDRGGGFRGRSLRHHMFGGRSAAGSADWLYCSYGIISVGAGCTTGVAGGGWQAYIHNSFPRRTGQFSIFSGGHHVPRSCSTQNHPGTVIGAHLYYPETVFILFIGRSRCIRGRSSQTVLQMSYPGRTRARQAPIPQNIFLPRHIYFSPYHLTLPPPVPTAPSQI